ncbi:protein FAM83H [Lampris incognitus]|uniref:protein FAM83H n=1 Tax=Lampris incognitus TaxID=2546036 RepID=UPI0024B53AA6|nr:protein FAM83H [Lampris incognitus]
MAHRSQCSSAGDNPLDPNYLPPHYREEYRLAIDALVEDNLEGYYQFLQRADVVNFLSAQEIEYIRCNTQAPRESSHPEQHYLLSGGDGSSDTYWPIHSDLDAPGLDLGWPQQHRFIGPTEVTTLVNPAEPDMPSIKEQARRLIKNAQQVVAVVMDIFTDVDIFADILDAALRNVAVYILLDEQNVHHFIHMVSNCQVNLKSIQFLRVRTVSGITYHCRSGKSFKGQMMDRFLLTDCRAVLSGNYSFMWSFEKIHRCLAHLFLGQLVSTFDEEFRILFAQSQPLMIETEDFSRLHERQYGTDKTPLYREPRKFLSIDNPHPEEWARHSFDGRTDMDWKKLPLSRHESIPRSLDQGSLDKYNKYHSQQFRMDRSSEHGPAKMPLNIRENLAFKRHSYAEGSQSRHPPYQFRQQQGIPNFETQAGQFQMTQHLLPRTGPEAGYSGYDKFSGHGYHPADQYSEPGLPQDMDASDSFNPVLNYLLSTSNMDFDQGSEELAPPEEVSFGSSHLRRMSKGSPYACPTSTTSPSPSEQKQFFQEPNMERKDPKAKQGLRNWRISSYLSAFDNAGDEGLPVPPTQAIDHFEVPLNPLQRTSSGPDLSIPKIPNVWEFKVPVVPRANPLPGHTKPTVPELCKKIPDDLVNMAVETKTTPTPSESSSVIEGDKAEEVEPKDPKEIAFLREESFRRTYNAKMQRSSKLRSSLIFSSQLEQQASQDLKSAPGHCDDETDKNEEDQSKLSFLAQALSQRRSFAREPFEWSRYKKSTTFDSSALGNSGSKDAHNEGEVEDSVTETLSKDLPGNDNSKGPHKPAEEPAKISPLLPQPKTSQNELLKTSPPLHPSKSLLSNLSQVDMNDPDNRLMFFKELAAERKAAKIAAEKSTEEASIKTLSDLKNVTVKNAVEEPSQPHADVSVKDLTTITDKNGTASGVENQISTETCKSVSLHYDADEEINKQENQPENGSNTSPTNCDKVQSSAFAEDSEKMDIRSSQVGISIPFSAGSAPAHSQSPVEPKPSNDVNECSHSCPPTKVDANTFTHSSPTDSVTQSTDVNETAAIDATLKVPCSLKSTLVELQTSPISLKSESNIQPFGPLHLESTTSAPCASSETIIALHPIGLQSSFSVPIPSAPSFSENVMSESISQNTAFDSSHSPSSTTLTSSSAPCTTAESISSKNNPSDATSTLTSAILSPKSNKIESKEFLIPSPLESQLTNLTPDSLSDCITQTVLSSESTHMKTESVNQCAHSETASTLDSVKAEFNVSADACLDDSKHSTVSVQSTTKKYCEESCTSKPDSETELPKSEPNFVPRLILGVSPNLNHPSANCVITESCLPSICGPESLSSIAGPETKKPTPSLNLIPAEPPTECAPAERTLGLDLIGHSEFSSKDAPLDTSLKLELIQGTSLSEPSVTESNDPIPAAQVLCSSPLPGTGKAIVSPKHEKTESMKSPVLSPSETSSPLKLSPTDLNKSTIPITIKSSSDRSLPEPTSKETSVLEGPSMACETPTESKTITSEYQPSELSLPIGNINLDNPCEVGREPEKLDSVDQKEIVDTKPANTMNKIASQNSVCLRKASDEAQENNGSETAETAGDGAVPLLPESKQAKTSSSRYHSSTASVISSSNLRDDTKLLLEQISANSQSRAEPTKESAVTDDDKEDEADKKANRAKAVTRSLSKGGHKTPEDRDKLLEKIQNMRKERKVYSRFEMPP